MRKLLAIAFAASLLATSAFAVDVCNPCPPAEKWVEVCETVQVEVPVTEYVDEPCEVQVTRMVPCETEVDATEGKWIFETKSVPYMRQVVECEEYVCEEPRIELRPEVRTRKAWKTICEDEERTVVEKVCEEVCDPCTGKIKKVWTEVCKTIVVPVKKKICVEEEYTVNVKCKVMVPVTKTRKVIRQVQDCKEVRTPKYIQVPVKRKVTVMKPVVETKTVMRKKAVCTTKTIEKQVVKRVKVPCEPEVVVVCEPVC